MSGQVFFANRRKIDTPSGSISYVEQGSGPVALFSMYATVRVGSRSPAGRMSVIDSTSCSK